MPALHRFELIGRVRREPVFHPRPSGPDLTVAWLVIAEEGKDSAGQHHMGVVCHRLVVWGTAAERFAQYCRQGTLLYVEGHVFMRYAKGQHQHVITEVVVHQWLLLEDMTTDQPRQPWMAPLDAWEDQPYEPPVEPDPFWRIRFS